MSIFEKASREKIRFATSKGNVTVEDLWDIPLISKNKFCLDEIAKGLMRQLKDSDVESFVLKTNKPNEGIQLRFDVIKHVIDTKIKEKEEKEQVALRKEKKAQIMAIIADKENEALKGTSLEDLKQMLAGL